MPSLTAHLIHLEPLELNAATQHPFLAAAATSSLPLSELKRWLGQDRLYALAYVNFIGSLLSKAAISSSPDRVATPEWRAADLLIDCLTNIRTELKMFEETAETEGWLEEICNVQPSIQTRAYQTLFAGAAAPSQPLLVGLTVLWATEECYLRSWKYASSKMDHGLKPKDKDVMQRVFIPNWSCPEFEALVRRLGALVNKFGQAYDEEGWEWRECENWWKQILWAEKEFWPTMAEQK
ncbi:hypothetical protein D0869_05256 [Hortaea werneckii]|uniref:Thiaminase-2/PQQC domain-containing protein n=1 Tax=Hortaea werneckii TaxID=91943 RepID=A0A3M6WYL0_HORWE|nr:hypothetical protein KC334_g10585 [Hortaea werneckii]KAI7013737.1 hypothetical protein KC355_g4928 [Hortaea werneckii]KAI7177350.1 hypothetical protein KC324_g9663 [Hortaea werneckii]KAI7578852.1 hypothetical protein KC316_g9690 [Hortaea werneckii]KAI7670547.1 hypothetical protein KC318_g3974 [Hortaea werneckii]